MSKNLQVAITKLDGKVVAITMTDDEHRVAEVLWQAPKPLSDEEKEKAKIRVLANPDVEQSHLTSNEIISQPVAWMIIDVDNGKSLQFKENKFSEINIPLYTAPKELSDEEITYQFQHKCPRFSRLDIFKYAVKWAEERHGIK